jgi:hypothetical protein
MRTIQFSVVYASSGKTVHKYVSADREWVEAGGTHRSSLGPDPLRASSGLEHDPGPVRMGKAPRNLN